MIEMISLLAQSSSADEGATTALGVLVSGLFLLFWLALFAFGIACFVLWIISLIHVIQHSDVKDRTMWILIIVLAGNLGGVIYYFVVKRSYDKGGYREIAPPAN